MEKKIYIYKLWNSTIWNQIVDALSKKLHKANAVQPVHTKGNSDHKR